MSTWAIESDRGVHSPSFFLQKNMLQLLSQVVKVAEVSPKKIEPQKLTVVHSLVGILSPPFG